MTKWEIGQDLIAISDFMSEKIADFDNAGLSNLVFELNKLRASVGDLFNKNNDHNFGIFDSSSDSKIVNPIVKPQERGE